MEKFKNMLFTKKKITLLVISLAMKIITDGSNTEGYFGPCQISMMKHFCENI